MRAGRGVRSGSSCRWRRLAPETAATEPPAEPGDAPLEVPLRVLLVEDHELNRQVALAMIERLGCRVDAVGDGRAGAGGAGGIDGSAYDIVLMDIELPGPDGLATTAELRRREAGTGRACSGRRPDGAWHDGGPPALPSGGDG